MLLSIRGRYSTSCTYTSGTYIQTMCVGKHRGSKEREYLCLFFFLGCTNILSSSVRYQVRMNTAIFAPHAVFCFRFLVVVTAVVVKPQHEMSVHISNPSLVRLLAVPLVVLFSVRARLGASLATGLVGTKENIYLGDFFACMGFLPLTCQRYYFSICMYLVQNATCTFSDRGHQMKTCIS